MVTNLLQTSGTLNVSNMWTNIEASYFTYFNFFMANHLILSNQSDTLESINSYQLIMKYMCNFERDMKLKVCSLTYQRHLIRSGTKFSSLSQGGMGYLVNCYVT